MTPIAIIALCEAPLALLGAVIIGIALVDQVNAWRSRRKWRNRHRGPTVIAVGEPRLRLPVSAVPSRRQHTSGATGGPRKAESAPPAETT